MECVLKSPVRTECGIFVMWCMQCCMCMSTVCSALMCCLLEVYKCLQ